MFMLFFGFIQSCFLKRFHADHLFDNEPIKAVNTCKLITFSVEIIYLIFCKNLILSIYQNIFIIFGVAIPGAISSSTITTANTELRTLMIDYYIKVDNECVLGNWTVAPKTLTLVGSGVEGSYTNVLFNVDKVAG